MTLAIIDNRPFNLSLKLKAGDILEEAEAEFLNKILHRRVLAKLRRHLSRGELDPQTLQQKGEELCALGLREIQTTDDDDDFDEDPIMTEAMNIAREIITAQMAKEGLPPPKGIDNHAKALVDGAPHIIEAARARIEARYKAAIAALGSP
jgi:hypothetical protein